MSVLIICANDSLKNEYRRAFKQVHVVVTAVKESLDGLSELNWFNPQVIVWHMAATPAKTDRNVLMRLRAKYNEYPLILLVASGDLQQEFKEMAQCIMLTTAEPDEVVQKAREWMVTDEKTPEIEEEPSSFSDFDFDDFG